MTRAPLLAGLAAALALAAAWEMLAAAGPGRVLRRLGPLARAGSDGRAPDAGERRRLALLGSGALLAAGALVVGPWAGAALALAGPSAVAALVRARKRRWRAELAAGVPTVARALADALAAGHSVRGAVEQAARGLRGAPGAELGRAASALALGEPTETVLMRLRERAGHRAYDTLVTAVLLQRDAGGDLAGLLRHVAAAHEETQRLEEEARAATAQARFTGLLVCALPLGAAVLAELATPGFIGHLASRPLSAYLAGMAAVLQAGALLAIRRLARVRA